MGVHRKLVQQAIVATTIEIHRSHIQGSNQLHGCPRGAGRLCTGKLRKCISHAAQTGGASQVVLGIFSPCSELIGYKPLQNQEEGAVLIRSLTHTELPLAFLRLPLMLR